ncbi:MAG: hypothetical protein H0V73_11350 [Chloroflexi bacterium]|nr:hypothetical protein [Chloroflexota bacterium]
MNLFTPDALRDRLGSRLKALGSGARDLPARQQTLRATIEWSYQLLEPAEQRLFELVSAFGASSVSAIEAVVADLGTAAAAEIDAIEGLTSLLDKSLIRQADADASAGRVAMLETIREYAAERLEGQPELAVAVRTGHARHFSDVAAGAALAAAGAEGEQALDDLFVDLDNLRIAWRHWVDNENLDRLGQMVDGLWHLYDERGWYHLTIELINDQLRVLGTRPPGAERSDQELTLRTSLARALTMLRGYTAEVEAEYLRILEMFEGQGQVPQLFPVLRSLGSFHGVRGEFDRAAVYADEIIQLAETQGDPSMRIDGQILAGFNIAFSGRIAEGLTQLDAAIEAFERGVYRRRRFRLGIDPRISCLTTSGMLLWLLGFPDTAVQRGNRAIELASELDHPYSLAYACYHAGFIHLWRLEAEAAGERATEALEVADGADLSIWQALGRCLLGSATSMLGRPEDGLRQIAEGLERYRGLRTPPVFWPLLRAMEAGAHLAAGDPQPALPIVDEALEVAGPSSIVAPALHITRGDILALAGHAESAMAAYEEARSVAARFAARSPELRALLRLCAVTTGEARAERIGQLRALHATFTEGFGAPDLIDAGRMIAEVGS